MTEKALTIYTDGGCHGNPGPGGWAYVMVHEHQITECYGSAWDTTNNRMELLAVIEALRAGSTLVGTDEVIDLHTDSQYVRNGITQWIHTWIRNGWRTAAKKPVKNQDLWQELHSIETQLKVHWNWVKGHAGNVHNERCDVLVQKAIAEMEKK
ncbi:MAG: ribonuclease HI [Spirochaetaceae bacterium]